MHIPDGFLDAKTWISTSLVGALAVGYALRRSKLTIDPRQVPQVALLGSFVFAAQMVNFPVLGATSGHFLGGALLAMMFGPALGIIVMTAVLMIQALLFQDGGVTALGANILCTAVLGTLVGYAVHRILHRFATLSAFLAGWLSIVVAALGVGCLLAISGTVSWSVALTAMFTWHSIIGIGEGLITALVYRYLRARRWGRFSSALRREEGVLQ